MMSREGAGFLCKVSVNLYECTIALSKSVRLSHCSLIGQNQCRY